MALWELRRLKAKNIKRVRKLSSKLLTSETRLVQPNVSFGQVHTLSSIIMFFSICIHLNMFEVLVSRGKSMPLDAMGPLEVQCRMFFRAACGPAVLASLKSAEKVCAVAAALVSLGKLFVCFIAVLPVGRQIRGDFWLSLVCVPWRT